MRNLTVRRAKSFVACLAKMRVYIEDREAGKTMINNVPCRKLGTLKNGEEKTFQIGEQAAKVFVIADRLSKGFCNEFYQLSEGQDDIILLGRNKYSLVTGNAFRFDNNDSEEVLANRKRSKRKGVGVLIVAAILGFIIGIVSNSGLFLNLFSDTTVEEKVFSSDGISFTLTDEFRETEIEGYTVAYESPYMAVFAMKEDFSLLEGFGEYTLEEYAELVILATSLGSTEAENVDGLICFDYDFTNPETNVAYKYYTYVFKTNNAFWAVQFVTVLEDAEEYEAQIFEWAKAIDFYE